MRPSRCPTLPVAIRLRASAMASLPIVASTTRNRPDRPPGTVTTLAVLQFLAAAATVIALLGNGELDGELDAVDIAIAVGAALVGAAIVGATWSGGRWAWWLQLVLALAAAVYGAITMATGASPGAPVFALGVL